jgi:O-antigen ligase
VLLGCPWPIAWGYGLLSVLVIGGLLVARWRLRIPLGLAILPLVWFGWQVAAGSQSVAPELSRATIIHFGACIACFYMGLLCVGRMLDLTYMLAGLLAGLLVVLATGFEQHFGGLDQTRKFFFMYIYPQLAEVPPEYLKKMSSNRIFSTLFYPNALAGVIVLLLPPVLSRVALANQRFTPAARIFLCGSIGVAAISCLVWSGSKGGWLLLLLIGFVALLRVQFDRRLKLLLVLSLALVGLVAFGIRYGSFFQKGATSVVARFDYWRAAIKTANANPILGTGPGTFATPYAKIKNPKSEMSRLVHNDYLEQASDSGWLGLVTYSVFICAALVRGFPRLRAEPVSRHASDRQGWLDFGVWLGVLGWALQSTFEFGLYIPALAWPAFAFLGWLLGRSDQREPGRAGAQNH